MGAGTSATEMIFFITSIIIALGVVSGLLLNIQSITSSAILGSKTLTGQLKTDIKIINDPELIPKSGSNYSFYVKNTGKEELGTGYISVIIDGVYISDSSLNKTIMNGDVLWLTGDVLRINASASLQTGSHNIRVITENGIEDDFSFRT